jgi:hypothetical protein
MDEIPIIIWENLSVGGLLALCIILILTGKLVRGSEVKYWREAFFEEQRQKQQLINAMARPTLEVLKALPPERDQEIV